MRTFVGRVARRPHLGGDSASMFSTVLLDTVLREIAAGATTPARP